MKKFLTIISALTIAFSFVGCSSKQDEVNEKPNEVAEVQKFDVEKIESEEGVAFVPDLATNGSLAEMPLGSETFELCGKEYTLPVKVSDLMADGWKLTGGEFKNEFDPKVRTSLASFAMKNEDGAVINLVEVYNDTDEVQKLEDCMLTGFYADGLEKDTTKVDIVFPGGITKESTAGDVVSVYGDPNNSELFTEPSRSAENQLSYNKHKESGFSFSYIFGEDGTLEYAKILASVE